MNINFTMTVHSFEAAAVLEKALNSNEIRFKVNVEDKPSLGAGKKSLRRTRVTKSEVLAVVVYRSDNPDSSDSAVAKKCGVSPATVGRIRAGTHTLQRSNGAI